jgi:hypothetical protein
MNKTFLIAALLFAPAIAGAGATDNIALNKPVRSNLSRQQLANVNDGNPATTWSATFFPACVDVDLMETCRPNKIVLHFPQGKKTCYTLYGSNDGKHFDRMYQTRTPATSPPEGTQIVFDSPIACRIVRLHIEFTDGDNKAYLSEIEIYGEKTGANTQTLRQATMEEILDVKPFDETAFNQPVTAAETIENVYGIIDRTIGAAYRDRFIFRLDDRHTGNDYFELSDAPEKIVVQGNAGLSLATGLNWYFKNRLNVHISEQTMQTAMPAQIVPIGATVRKETPCKVRYAFNYCTLNYTFSFFGESDWQRENDWLALNGVNVVLDLAGQEATWIKFLMDAGYTFDDAKDWLTGPAYGAWQFMDNMERFGGPLPDGYVKDRLELARSAQRWRTSLGMQTVLQGYAGMVPTDFGDRQPGVTVIPQGNWNGFVRPSMIATDSPHYDEYARKFYRAQAFVFGKTSRYYAVDPFHEGGIRPTGLTDDEIAGQLLQSLLEHDNNAVWIVQGWQSNPTNALLKGMGELKDNHVLIVDLIKYPIPSGTKYNKLKYGSTTLDAPEFNGANWAWCLLANFGGNPSMHGQLDIMTEDILNARKTCSHMQGIGIISEAMHDNPIVYDLLFDLAWADDNFDLTQWIDRYIQRRYGGTSENVRLAWRTMRNSNYNHGVRYTNELFGMKNKAPQDYTAQNIPYGAANLETAFKLLLEDYERFKHSESYRYDLAEIMRQLVSNYAVLTYNDLLTAKANRSTETFKRLKQEFLNAFDVLNSIQATQKEQLGGEWIGKAVDRARHYDDFAAATFAMNAKTLITTWGSRGSASLKDYGWRNYEGMFIDLNKAVWSEYLDKVEQNLTTGAPIQTIAAAGYFNFYWNWILNQQNYTRIPRNSPEEIKAIADRVVLQNSFTQGLDPNAGNLALGRTVQVNTENITGNPCAATDGTVETQLSLSASTAGGLIYPEIVVDLIGEFQISRINTVLDNTGNASYRYELYASSGTEWEKIAENNPSQPHPDAGDTLTIDNHTARFIKIRCIADSKHPANPAATTIALNEIRIYGERILPAPAQLEKLINAVRSLNLNANTQAQIHRIDELTALAEDALNRAAPPDELNAVYWNLYDHIVALDLSGRVNIAIGKTVSAHNDPSGNSHRINDGDPATHWDGGRLSPPGLPYQQEISPAWIVIDLAAPCNIDEIHLQFAKSNIRHKYELHAGADNIHWNKIAEKTSEALPNDNDDTHRFSNLTARYIKLVATDVQLESSGKRNPYHVSELEIYGTPQ